MLELFQGTFVQAHPIFIIAAFPELPPKGSITMGKGVEKTEVYISMHIQFCGDECLC